MACSRSDLALGLTIALATSCQQSGGQVEGSRPAATAKPIPGAVEPRRLVAEERAMGTVITIQAFASDDASLPAPAQATVRAALDEVQRIERLMSPWIDTSDVARLNRDGAREAVAVAAETFEVLERSRWASERSGGAFDITFEVFKGLWRFDHDMDGVIPPHEQIEARRKLIDYRQISLDARRQTARLGRPETRINLGGIAKGYAVDRAARVLTAGGLTSFLIQAGGDLYARGRKPGGEPWMVGVRDPRGPETSFFGTMPVEDHAFSTAGDYERGFVRDGKRYHHIIDPRTGYPAAASRSVTVWASDAFTADAIDDAIFILGPREGIDLCESVEGCGAVVVDASNRVWVSSRLSSLFQQHRPPTDGP